MKPSPTFLSAGVFLLAAVGAVACSSAMNANGDVASGAVVASRPGELIRLRTRDGDVALLVGSAGRKVSLYDASGTLVRSADVESLRSSDPALFEMLTTATGQNTYLDATYRQPEAAPSPVPGAAAR